jgi:hypothetical protein
MTTSLPELIELYKERLARSRATLQEIRNDWDALMEYMKGKYWTKSRREARYELQCLEGIYTPQVLSQERRVALLIHRAESEVGRLQEQTNEGVAEVLRGGSEQKGCK